MKYPKCPICGAYAPWRDGVGAFVCRNHTPSKIILLKDARDPETGKQIEYDEIREV